MSSVKKKSIEEAKESFKPSTPKDELTFLKEINAPTDCESHEVRKTLFKDMHNASTSSMENFLRDIEQKEAVPDQSFLATPRRSFGNFNGRGNVDVLDVRQTTNSIHHHIMASGNEEEKSEVKAFEYAEYSIEEKKGEYYPSKDNTKVLFQEVDRDGVSTNQYSLALDSSNSEQSDFDVVEMAMTLLGGSINDTKQDAVLSSKSSEPESSKAIQLLSTSSDEESDSWDDIVRSCSNIGNAGTGKPLHVSTSVLTKNGKASGTLNLAKNPSFSSAYTQHSRSSSYQFHFEKEGDEDIKPDDDFVNDDWDEDS